MPQIRKKPGLSLDRKSRKKKNKRSEEDSDPVVTGKMDPNDIDDDDDDDSIVLESDDGGRNRNGNSNKLAIPFSDGIVASCLNDLIVAPRIESDEVELLREFLIYYASTETFIGTISNKMSFMKKQGGLLL